LKSSNESANFSSLAKVIANKVPAITIAFWIIKILCTTIGETAADFLNSNLHLGLTGTTIVMSFVLVAALIAQFKSNTYMPTRYWAVVVLVSIVGTLVTDNLSDNFGVSLITTTAIFSLLLAAVFGFWQAVEKTLSVHAINTVRREIFYWLTILCAFALGTASGDLISERLNWGYLTAVLFFASIIVVITIAHNSFGLNSIFAFWIAYIVTRPLGASIGDLLSQPKGDGGFGLGTVGTSCLFFVAICISVYFLTRTTEHIENSN
jgi:uncharacterized membrane-anchored protein